MRYDKSALILREWNVCYACYAKEETKKMFFFCSFIADMFHSISLFFLPLSSFFPIDLALVSIFGLIENGLLYSIRFPSMMRKITHFSFLFSVVLLVTFFFGNYPVSCSTETNTNQLTSFDCMKNSISFPR